MFSPKSSGSLTLFFFSTIYLNIRYFSSFYIYIFYIFFNFNQSIKIINFFIIFIFNAFFFSIVFDPISCFSGLVLFTLFVTCSINVFGYIWSNFFFCLNFCFLKIISLAPYFFAQQQRPFSPAVLY